MTKELYSSGAEFCILLQDFQPITTVHQQYLQAGDGSNNELAEQIGLSPSPCWRRVKRLEAEGVIRGYQAVFDRRRLGLGVTVFVSVSIERNDTAAHQAFEQAVVRLPEVVACHIVGGQHDFLLQVVVEDLDAYAAFALHTLGQLPGVREIHSSFVLKEVKPPMRLPLRAAAPASPRPARGHRLAR